MAGKFFKNESHMGPSEMCACIIARDEDDPDNHLHNSQYIYQCPEHLAAGSTPKDIYHHHWSRSTVDRVLLENLPETAFVAPALVKFENGVPVVHEVTGDKIPHEPHKMLMNFRQGQIAVRHSDIDKELRKKVAAALKANPDATLNLADDKTHDAVFAAHDEHVETVGEAKPHLFWHAEDGTAKIIDHNNPKG